MNLQGSGKGTSTQPPISSSGDSCTAPLGGEGSQVVGRGPERPFPPSLGFSELCNNKADKSERQATRTFRLTGEDLRKQVWDNDLHAEGRAWAQLHLYPTLWTHTHPTPPRPAHVHAPGSSGSEWCPATMPVSPLGLGEWQLWQADRLYPLERIRKVKSPQASTVNTTPQCTYGRIKS